MSNIKIDLIKEGIINIFSALGMSDTHSEWISDSLIDAETSGIYTHGLRLVKLYANGLKAGAISKSPNIITVKQRGPILKINGGNGLGQIVGKHTVNKALDIARENGVCVSTICNSNDLGAIGYYTRYAAKKRMIAFLTQITVENMAPWGGTDPNLGNNPFSFALPTDSECPIVLDMACSIVAKGNVKVAASKGKKIPKEWAYGPDGLPTTNPVEALKGAMRPFSNHKGSGLAVIMGALAGVLSGSNFGADIPPMSDFRQERNIGFFLLLVDIESVLEWPHYISRLQKYISRIKHSSKAETFDGIKMPGEIENMRRKECQNKELNIDKALLKEIHNLAVELNVSINF